MIQHVLLCFLLHVVLCTFASEKAPLSTLQLFSDKDPEPVALGHEYYFMTDKDKRNSLYLQEGCYTILDDTQKDACVLVGPLHPSQLLSLYINDKNTVVAHISANSNFSDLLKTIKERCQPYDSSKISGELFTNNALLYDRYVMCAKKSNFKIFCLKEIYQHRTQLEELKFNKDKIIEAFNIKDRRQIKARKFTSSKKDLELGNYNLAELYVVVKKTTYANNNNNKPETYNICPMAETYFGDVSHLPIKNRCDKTIEIQNSRPNPFCENQPEDKLFSYGALPFHYIPYPISDN